MSTFSLSAFLYFVYFFTFFKRKYYYLLLFPLLLFSLFLLIDVNFSYLFSNLSSTSLRFYDFVTIYYTLMDYPFGIGIVSDYVKYFSDKFHSLSFISENRNSSNSFSKVFLFFGLPFTLIFTLFIPFSITYKNFLKLYFYLFL